MSTTEHSFDRISECLHHYAKKEKRSLFRITFVAALQHQARQLQFTAPEKLTMDLPTQAIGTHAGARPDQVAELMAWLGSTLKCSIPDPDRDDHNISDMIRHCFLQLHAKATAES